MTAEYGNVGQAGVQRPYCINMSIITLGFFCNRSGNYTDFGLLLKNLSAQKQIETSTLKFLYLHHVKNLCMLQESNYN